MLSCVFCILFVISFVFYFFKFLIVNCFFFLVFQYGQGLRLSGSDQKNRQELILKFDKKYRNRCASLKVVHLTVLKMTQLIWFILIFYWDASCF